MNLNSESWLVFFEVVKDRIDYHHLMGFEQIPDQDEIDRAIEEVKNDKEFGLGDKIYDLSYKILSKNDGFELARIMLND